MRTVQTYAAKDGSVTYRVRFRLNGKQTTQTFRGGAAAKVKAEQFAKWLDVLGARGALQQLDADEYAASVPSLDEVAADYIAHRTGISEGTRVDYRRQWERTWGPLIGHLPANTVGEDAVSRAVLDLAKRYSYKSLQNHRGLLAGVCGRAVRKGYLTESPTNDLKLPRTRVQEDDGEMTFLTPDEFNLLLAEIPDHWEPLVMMLAGTGMRWGEAAALLVGDIDVASPDPKKWTVRIVKAVKHDRSTNKRTIGPPKTNKSRRTIALPPEVVPLLDLDRPAKATLFVGPRGAPISNQNFWMYVWRPAVWRAQHCPNHIKKGCRCGTGRPGRCPLHKKPPEPCGCPGTLTKNPRIHDLRHSHASWLIAANIPLPVIQARLGHESITTTVDRYGHLMPDAQQQAAYAASLVFNPAANPTVSSEAGRRPLALPR